MSNAFREYLRKIGSGPHTGQDLTRAEAAAATRMLLLQEATPAQIGAFLIAHRIKRPTGEELAGMLDTYDELGPKLQPVDFPHPVTVMGSPYDGRSRTAPISPLTALILATVDCPVIQHGGRRMPTKEGTPLIDIWQGLGTDWTRLSLSNLQQVFARTGIGFVYLPVHFPQAEALVPYREQIGKRPPLATLELIWSPYADSAHVVAGFVHPPTEEFARNAFLLRKTSYFTLIKGLEGSCDLPRERTAIIGISGTGQLLLERSEAQDFERLHLVPRDYHLDGKNVQLDSTSDTIQQIQAALNGQACEYRRSLLWNGGFYLWRCGVSPTLTAGIELTETLLKQGRVLQKLQEIQTAIAALT
jgi:anthranilate phosphoribosyltransferase